MVYCAAGDFMERLSTEETIRESKMTVAIKAPPALTPKNEWPIEDLEYLGACPICSNKDRTHLHGALTDRLFGCAPGHWQLYTCTACKVAYIDPRPTKASIGRAYTTYFTHAEINSADEHKAQTLSIHQRIRRWALAGLNDYRNARWNTHLKPAKPWGRAAVAAIPPIRNLLVAHMRHLPRRPPYPGARLLDVGCGSGAFLELAQSSGWQVQGVDFDPVAVAAARSRGLDVRCGGLEQMVGNVGTYDYLTCSHVIEHLHEPKEWIKTMYTLLRPSGKLWLQTPNIESLGNTRFGPHWRDLDPPRHLVLFTPKTLEAILRSANFEVRFLPLPMLMAVPVYDASRNLAEGKSHTDGFAWRSLLHIPTLWRALAQSLRPNNAEFITVEATRIG
jgi:2-polyprenyl-3-methyl-5-hydroxy-6-metoxy-1,4-benzoquinol methylase